MKNLKLKTDFPIAYESPDHLMPWGTMRDNSTNPSFIQEVQDFFKYHYDLDKIKFMDIGCSGGQLAVDFYKKGNMLLRFSNPNLLVSINRFNSRQSEIRRCFCFPPPRPLTRQTKAPSVLCLLSPLSLPHHFASNPPGLFLPNLLPFESVLGAFGTKVGGGFELKSPPGSISPLGDWQTFPTKLDSFATFGKEAIDHTSFLDLKSKLGLHLGLGL
jgi:hypothetical protein